MYKTVRHHLSLLILAKLCSSNLPCRFVKAKSHHRIFKNTYTPHKIFKRCFVWIMDAKYRWCITRWDFTVKIRLLQRNRKLMPCSLISLVKRFYSVFLNLTYKTFKSWVFKKKKNSILEKTGNVMNIVDIFHTIKMCVCLFSPIRNG